MEHPEQGAVSPDAERRLLLSLRPGRYALSFDDNGTLRRIANPQGASVLIFATAGFVTDLGVLGLDPSWASDGTVARE